MAGEIFISYRRADAAWARRLHELLRSEGVEAWYDALVGAGQDWRIATAKALEASKIFVLLFSENAAQSSDIAKELAAAVLEKKLIVPVRLQNIAPKGAFLYELASRNWINAFDNTEARLAELAKGLAHLISTGVPDESLLPFDKVEPHVAPRKRTLLLAAAGLVVVAASATAAWFLWPAPHWTVESSRPFISTLALEDYPAFSPNGATLAYTSGPAGGHRQIYMRNLSGGEGIKLTNDGYDDISPVWSSDGGRIAYVAIKSGEPCRIMVTAVPAGEAREAGRCRAAESSAIAWQPGTPFVYAVERNGLKGDVIFRLNLDTGARENIVESPALRDSIESPRISPDGKFLAYVLRGEEIILRDLKSGRTKVLGEVSQQGNWDPSLAWSEDSATLLVSIAAIVGGSEIVAYPTDGSAPYTLYITAAKLGKLAAGGGKLALESDISRSGLARAGATPSSQPDLIDPANGLTWSPSFAPDGTLAFLSNRSGTNAIWLMKPGAPPAMLFDAGSSNIYRVRFSPDGTKLAVANETTRSVILRIMSRAGATMSTFTMPSLGLGLPSWTPDSKAVLVFDRYSRRTMRIPIDNNAARSPFAPPHWVGIAARSDGTFAIRADQPGIWRIDDGIKQINNTYPAYYFSPLAFRGNDVLVPDYHPGDGNGSNEIPRILAQPLSGGPSHIAAYAPDAVNRDGFQSDFDVNPVNGEIVYVAEVSRDTNIDLLTLARR